MQSLSHNEPHKISSELDLTGCESWVSGSSPFSLSSHFFWFLPPFPLPLITVISLVLSTLVEIITQSSAFLCIDSQCVCMCVLLSLPVIKQPVCVVKMTQLWRFEALPAQPSDPRPSYQQTGQPCWLQSSLWGPKVCRFSLSAAVVETHGWSLLANISVKQQHLVSLIWCGASAKGQFLKYTREEVMCCKFFVSLIIYGPNTSHVQHSGRKTSQFMFEYSSNI